MYNSALIIEGGGMRGVFAAGVMDFFIDKNIDFSSCYAVSAGAGHCCSFLSKQRKRAFNVNVDYLKNKNYASIYSLIKTGDFFGVDFIYNKIPNKLNLYDYDTFDSYEGKFFAVVTNCLTGKAEYLQVKDLKKDMKYVVASSSLPMLSRDVIINNIPYLDGGISDSVPVLRSIKDGNSKNVIILTRNKGYRKKPNSVMPLLKMKYKKYPNLLKALERRHIMYNKEMEYIEKLEKEGKVFVIRPTKPVNIGRLEKNYKKLESLYKEGYKDAARLQKELFEYLNK